MAQNEFSNPVPVNPLGSLNSLTGNRFESTPTVASIYALTEDTLPPAFPLAQWQDQAALYYAYWAWFNGDYINQTKQGANGETLYKFPLRINTLRDIVRKHASVLFGEAPDGPRPLVETSITARNGLTGEAATDEQKKFAKLCEAIVNEVWFQSNGRAIQQEGGELTQFLGGHVYQLSFQPWRKDLLVPVVLRSWKADMFLPIWENGDYWNLSEAYIVCRIEAAQAKNQYGIETTAVFCTYVEHWTRKKYSIFIDGTPVTLVADGRSVTYKDVENPFGIVPFYYIPHLREGGFFGSSHVPDLVGLIQEYNYSMANLGDAIADNIDRDIYIRNSSQRTKVELPNSKEAVNLGMQNPSNNHPPDAFAIDPPQLAPGLTNHPQQIYNQIRRTAFLPAVAEGEDEGSQRSGVTLDIRFWPATAHAKAERSFWETGLNLIAKGILTIIHTKRLWSKYIPELQQVKDNFMTQLSISQDWFPQIPRDRASEVNEILARVGQFGMSPATALDKFGDIEDKEAELEEIREWAAFLSSLKTPAQEPGKTTPLNSNRFAENSDAIDNN